MPKPKTRKERPENDVSLRIFAALFELGFDVNELTAGLGMSRSAVYEKKKKVERLLTLPPRRDAS